MARNKGEHERVLFMMELVENLSPVLSIIRRRDSRTQQRQVMKQNWAKKIYMNYFRHKNGNCGNLKYYLIQLSNFTNIFEYLFKQRKGLACCKIQ